MPLPNAEPIGLPAPVWLLQFLLLLTFVLHYIPMTVTVGGALAGLVMEVRGRLQPNRPFKQLAGRVWGILPSVTAFTITLGVAPLLFVQLIYGKFFYPASVLTGWSWFAVVLLLIAGYYMLYLQAMGPKEAWWRPWAGLIAVGTFLAVAAVYVSTMSLTVTPEVWQGMYAESQKGLHFVTNLPRYLHVLLTIIAGGGVTMAVLGHYAEERELSGLGRTCGLTWAGLATVLQLPVSLWYLSTLNEIARGAVATWMIGAGGGLAVVSVAILLVSRKGERRPLMGWAATGAMALSFAVMAIQRHLVRQALLAPHIDVAADWKLEPQWDVFAIFALLLLFTIGLLGYLFVGYLKEIAAHAKRKAA